MFDAGLPKIFHQVLGAEEVCPKAVLDGALSARAMAKWVSPTPVGHQRDGLGDVSQEMDGRGGPEARAIMGSHQARLVPQPRLLWRKTSGLFKIPFGPVQGPCAHRPRTYLSRNPLPGKWWA